MAMTISRLLPFTLCLFALPLAADAVAVTATANGISIDAGAAGVYVMSYPTLRNPNDGGATPAPDQVIVKPDGSGATLIYKPSGKATLDRQPDGSWLYHFTEIPEDRVKFAFGIHLPLTLSAAGATWSFDGAPPKTFPKDKGALVLYQGNPKTFVFTHNQAGFVLSYPTATWTMLTDQRSWGKDFFGYGQILYFPKKKHVPEISYSFKVADLSAPTTPVTPAPK
jgi:hypothetical protein